MNKYGGVTLSDVLRVIFGPFVLILFFIILAFLALCEEIHSWFGSKRRDWMADREDYYDGVLKPKCKNCGTDYVDPKYCSVWGWTADEHQWLKK